MSTFVFDVKGVGIDGNKSTQSFRFPSKNDWKKNLQYINKKISKKFTVADEYGLSINYTSKIRFDDIDQFAQVMNNLDLNNDELCIEIIDINDVKTNDNCRIIIVHYGDNEFTFKVSAELSELDDEIYDELLDEAKTYFKIKGRMPKLYEDVGGKKIFVDDWDDLSEQLEQQTNDEEPLHLYLDGKGNKKQKQKQKQKSSSSNDPLYIWCNDNGFIQYFNQLKEEVGIEKPSDFNLLELNDLTNICNDLSLGIVVKRKFINAIQRLKNVKPKTEQTVKVSDANNITEEKSQNLDEKQQYQPSNPTDPLFVWCKENKCEQYYNKFKHEFAIKSLPDLALFSENDIDELCSALGLRFGRKVQFKRVVKELKTQLVSTKTVDSDDSKESDELFVWCKQIGISKFYDVLKEQIESPLDFIELTSTEIDDLCNDIQIKFGFKSKFKKAIKEIQAGKEEKKEEKEEAKVEVVKPSRPKRNLRGIVLVPCARIMECRAPHKSRRSKSKKKQSGFGASLMESVTNSFFSFDTKNPKQLNTRKEKKQVFNAPQHRIIGSGSNKVIMIIGHTGVGKTTLINSMMNYIYDVEYDDPYRFRLIQEKPKLQGQAESQTDHVSTYHIRHEDGWRIPYDLTIIDTPGFAHTHGIEKDKQIVADIRYLFENMLDSIDGVCFVAKSPDRRLTPTHNYVFNNVLNLFAKDILENIFVLLTFCDGKRPPFMDILRHHPTLRQCKTFKLNNSVYWEDPTNRNPNEDDSFEQMFWTMGSKCFENFFKSLNQTRTKSINDSRFVLEQREAIQVKIESISSSVDNALSKQQNIDDQERMIRQKQKEMDANQQVWHNEKLQKWVQIQTSYNSMTCFRCRNRTCHPRCPVSNKYDCCVMNSDNVCTVCGCHVQEHRNTDYKYELKTETKRVSNWDQYGSQKDQFEAAKLCLSKSTMIIRALANEKQELEKQVHRMIADILRFRNYLEKVALRPALTTFDDYIDQLIQNEEDSPNRDNQRIKHLRKYKNQENYIQQILKTGDKTRIDDLCGIRTNK